VIADKPQDFAANVLELLADPDRQRRLGEAGWELVRSNYDWGPLAEKQNKIWQSLKRS